MFEHGKPSKRKQVDAYAKYVNLLFLPTKKGRRCCLYMNIRHVYPQKKKEIVIISKNPLRKTIRILINYVND